MSFRVLKINLSFLQKKIDFQKVELFSSSEVFLKKIVDISLRCDNLV